MATLRASATLAAPRIRPCCSAPARTAPRRASRLLCRAAPEEESVLDKLKKKAADFIPSVRRRLSRTHNVRY
jgi:hypothetical protein